MSDARKKWNLLKSNLEDDFGKDFVKKNFTLDLGPNYDALDKLIDSLEADISSLEKSIEELRKAKQKILESRKFTQQKLDAYEKIIKEASKASKTQHGAQIGKLLELVDEAGDKKLSGLNATILKIGRTLAELHNMRAS